MLDQKKVNLIEQGKHKKERNEPTLNISVVDQLHEFRELKEGRIFGFQNHKKFGEDSLLISYGKYTHNTTLIIRDLI